ncbi:hypothetical protein HWV23_01105 [Natronomonas halophila]|uniref:DUF7124 domain-containing protein n=1 Tax=Natronomonas halophila TaxID=2747817 RepID=UPI0015B5760A|nr:hypothetical protein [Natronomonas halophila]QLD84362.1 hypothetical protein HWV23_01105 [Natronomonas halophila]
MSLTLAFELAAARRLADPEGAVADARTWSDNVGFVTDRPPHVLTKFTRDNHIRNDFQPAVEPAAETLAHLLDHFETDRFVLVATEADTAPEGWEYQHIEAAAERADWELREASAGTNENEENEDTHATRERDDWP